METIIRPQIAELTSDEVRLSAPLIMNYLKEGNKSNLPQLSIILGPVGAGKSNYIKNNYSEGYVWIDMARIFFDLQRLSGIRLNRRNEIINFIGVVTMDLALLEKRNIVVEMIGEDLEKIDRVIDLMKSHGYDVKITMVNSVDESCFPAPAQEVYSISENMSSYYTEDFHLDWIEKTAA